MSNCICLICFKPNEIWLDFLSAFIKYDIYLIIDDNEVDYNTIYKNKYPKINFIQINNNTSYDNGYYDTNHIGIKRLVSGWDKSLYYFCEVNTNYKNVWFIEDDVFFCNEDAFSNIDIKYPNSDLLSNEYEMYDGKTSSWPHWKDIEIGLELPYYHAMVCAVRMSNMMLSCIKMYKDKVKYHKLFFIEALFPTIAMKWKLQYDVPQELNTIYWRHEFNIKDINCDNLYHPMKDVKRQQRIHLTKMLKYKQKIELLS